MIASIRNWWANHGKGERALMALLGGAMLIVILWLGILRPVTTGLDAAWARQAASLDRYGSVSARVEALKRLPAKPRASAGTSVDQLVSQTAGEAGFTLDRVGNPGAGRMSVSIASARMSALLGWLSQLEAAGVGIQTISIAPGTTDGTVTVQAVFAETAP